MSTTIQSLCLTCSASLPPRKKTQDAPQGECFITKCCSRAICPACILANPRLSRYHPCLACLAGVSAVASSSGLNSKHTFRGTSASGRLSGNPRGLLSSHGTEPKTWVQIETASSDDAVLSFANVDGSLRDGDLFIVGDDEDDETSSERVSNSGSPPPPYPEFPLPSSPLSRATATVIRPLSDHNEDNIVTQHVIGGPVHDTITIDKSDTLLGIALRYGVDARTLCRINALPPSTITTTPHLLHTRTTLKLPSNAQARLPESNVASSSRIEESHRKSRTTERAAKKVQLVTKEADWRVAKVYADLASMPMTDEETQAMGIKRKELGRPVRTGGVEERAVDAYLEDREWEARERRLGRVPRSLLPAMDDTKMKDKEMDGRQW